MKIFFFLFLSVLLKVGRLLERIEGKLLKTFGDKFLVMNFLLCEPSTKISTFLPPLPHTHYNVACYISTKARQDIYLDSQDIYLGSNILNRVPASAWNIFGYFAACHVVLIIFLFQSPVMHDFIDIFILQCFFMSSRVYFASCLC